MKISVKRLIPGDGGEDGANGGGAGGGGMPPVVVSPVSDNDVMGSPAVVMAWGRGKGRVGF